MDIFELDKQFIAGTYKRFPVAITHGNGSLLYGIDGKEYIDMGSGIGVTAFGSCDAIWIEAVTAQLGKVQHTSNLYYTEPCVKLAQAMCQRTGMKKVFFSNSGAESNECAIKAARKYAAEKKGENCYTVVTLRNSFHGRTLTTLSATGQDHYHELYRPLTPGFVSVPANDMDELRALSKSVSVAAVMIECIQGEGGVIPLEAGYVRELASFCAENDIILITDEVQTGNGRTGALYSYMNYGIVPDAVSTAKGLGGGLPIGATLLGEKLKDVFGYGDHGSTFGGNPVACAGALSVFERLDDGLLKEVREKSGYVFSELENAKGIEDVTGAGLMIGVKTVRPAAEIVKECMENGVLCLTAKDKVRLLPALNIPFDILSKAIDVIKTACSKEA